MNLFKLVEDKSLLTGWLNKPVTELPKFDGELCHEFSLFGDFKAH